jgi:hypothetical protein
MNLIKFKNLPQVRFHIISKRPGLIKLRKLLRLIFTKTPQLLNNSENHGLA